jgi:SAM-dependent methyltransferase
MEIPREPWQRILVCPVCRTGLDAAQPELLRCRACGRSWPQPDPRVVDLMVPEGSRSRRRTWQRQQREMIGQYDELAADREHALVAFRSDFDPLAPVLGGLRGQVVDVGGGQGLVRHWLPEPERYLVVDPETGWLDQPWEQLADAFPCLERTPAFVRGLAERLPLPDACADGVLSIFNLNHLIEPARALREMTRVLRPGGRLVLVLDDLPPRWRDLAAGGSYPVRDEAQRRRLRWSWLAARLVGHRVAPDHLPIRERKLRSWTRGLELLERRWRGAYLCLVYSRPEG